MYLIVLKVLFSLSAIALAGLLLSYKKVVSKVKDNLKVARYVSLIAGIFFLYIVCAICLLFAIKSSFGKAMMLFFAIAPFIIGKLATYEKVKIYSILQIFLAIISGICVYLF